MARSPGFYYNEIDNTSYLSNIETPKTGTTVAVIGYATKGEYNTPVEITSYSNFVKKFGEPVQDQYSGIAVKRILNNGGKILFVRVLNENNASKSNVIVKNGKDKVNSKIIIKKNSINLSDDGYSAGTILVAKLLSKVIKIRTKINNGVNSSTIISSIKNSLNETKPYSEFKILKDSFTSFNLATSDEEIGPFFVDFTGKNSTSSKLNELKNIKNTSNYYKIFLSSNLNGNDSLRDSNIGLELDPDDENNKYGLKIDDSELVFNLQENSTINDLVEFLSNNNKSGVEVKFIEGTDYSYFLLYKKNGESFTISSDVKNKCLFDNGLLNTSAGENEVECKDYASGKIGIDSKIYKNKEVIGIPVEFVYNETSGTISAIVADGEKHYSIENSTYDFGEKASEVFKEIIYEDYSPKLDYKVYEENKKIIIETDQINTVDLSSFNIIDEDYLRDLTYIFDEKIEYVQGAEAIDENSKDMVKFEAVEYGSGTKGISVEVVKNKNAFDNTETNNIYIKSGNNIENFLNISFDKNNERYFKNIINQEADNGGSRFITVDVKEAGNNNGIVQLEPGVYVLGQSKKQDAVQGNIASEDWEYDYRIGENGVNKDDQEATTSIFTNILDVNGELANDDLYDFDILITPDCIIPEVQTAAIALCEKTMSSIYIIDTPIGIDRDTAIDWHNGKGEGGSAINSTYAAVYWPWLKIYDDITNKNVYVMPSVLMAAQYVYTDKVGPWNATAGVTFGSIPALDIEKYPNKIDRDALYTNGNVINPFIKQNNGTILAYGEKTTQRIDSTLSKIHTRRTLIKIRKELKSVLNGFIFKQGIGENIKLMNSYATTILDRYKSNKAIASYRVDTSRNTTASLQQDVVYIDVFVTPVGCIEEVNISFTLDKGNETVN